MTILNKDTSNYGGIFSDRDEPNRIEFLWRDNQAVDGRRSQQHKSTASNDLKRAETNALNTDERYDIAVSFDGSTCRFFLNGDQFFEVDCSSRFKGMITDPHLCYNGWGNGWNGLIENVRFDGSRNKGI